MGYYSSRSHQVSHVSLKTDHTEGTGIFSKGSQFCITMANHCMCVWWYCGKMINPANVVGTHTNVTPGIIVWGAIGYDPEGTVQCQWNHLSVCLTPPGQHLQQHNACPRWHLCLWTACIISSLQDFKGQLLYSCRVTCCRRVYSGCTVPALCTIYSIQHIHMPVHLCSYLIRQYRSKALVNQELQTSERWQKWW